MIVNENVQTTQCLFTALAEVKFLLENCTSLHMAK